MYTNNRNAYRQHFFNTWQKHLKRLPLEATEIQLIDIILQHPEYHRFLNDPKQFETQEFALEENPFFHMSLHLAVREQIHTRRPTGIEMIYQNLLKVYGDALRVEHLMMQQLLYMMDEGQRTGAMPSDEEYIKELKKIR
jgi:hypothetical protein